MRLHVVFLGIFVILLLSQHGFCAKRMPKSSAKPSSSKVPPKSKGSKESDISVKLKPASSQSQNAEMFSMPSYNIFNDSDAWATARHVSGLSIAFITSWNTLGKEHAITLAQKGKLDVVVPVMYESQPVPENPALQVGHLTGGDTFSDDDISSWKENGLQVMPRVYFLPRKWNIEQFRVLMLDSNARDSFIDELVTACQTRKYDGIVLEVLVALFSCDGVYQDLMDFIRFSSDLVDAFHASGLKIFLVVPPFGEELRNDVRQVLYQLQSYDLFVLMAYDAPNPPNRGIAPYMWVEDLVHWMIANVGANKILLGIPFYGAEYVVLEDTSQSSGKEAEGTKRGQFRRHVICHDIVGVFNNPRAKLVDFKHDQSDHETNMIVAIPSGENKAESGPGSGSEPGGEMVETLMYFPTRMSIMVKVKLANEMLHGVSIWELGQGCPSLWAEL